MARRFHSVLAVAPQRCANRGEELSFVQSGRGSFLKHEMKELPARNAYCHTKGTRQVLKPKFPFHPSSFRSTTYDWKQYSVESSLQSALAKSKMTPSRKSEELESYPWTGQQWARARREQQAGCFKSIDDDRRFPVITSPDSSVSSAKKLQQLAGLKAVP